jgi:hypothetical protein
LLTLAGTPGTDDWFLVTIAAEMGANFPRLHKLRRYREGDAPVPGEASASMRDAYVSFVNMSRLNMCDLIVNAKTNRQKAVGFRTAAVGDELGDDAAWATWKRSHMAVGSRRLFADAGHYGDAFVSVIGTDTPGSDGSLLDPYMVPSNGWTTWTMQDALRPWLALAAITVGYDPIMGVDRILLYRAGQGGQSATLRVAEKPTSKSTIPNNGQAWKPGVDWTWTGAPIYLNYTQDVPVVRYSTLTRMGFYETHLDSIDRYNDGIKQRLTITAMQAFRQRAIKGDLPSVYPADHENAGEPIDYNEIFKAGPAALWMLPDGADIWESATTDITPLLAASKDDLRNIAAVTGTPLYTLSPEGASGSATGAEVARETLTFGVEELNDIASEVFAQAHSLAFQASRDTSRTDPAQIETIWASIDRASIIDRATGAKSAKEGGATQRMIDEKVFGLTPAEQRQAEQDRQDEAFLLAGEAA